MTTGYKTVVIAEAPPPELADQWWPTTWYPNPEDDPDYLYQLALEYGYYLDPINF